MDVFSFLWKFPVLFPLYNQQIIFALLLVIPYKTLFFRYMSSTEEAGKCDLLAGTEVGVTQCLSGLISLVPAHSGPEGLPRAATAPAMPSAALAHPVQGASLQRWDNSKISNTVSCRCTWFTRVKVRMEHRHNLKYMKIMTWGRTNERVDMKRELWLQ